MQTILDHAKVDAFKNWFFGRVPAAEHVEDSFFDVPVHVATEADLPVEGDTEAKYYVVETGDTYRYRDGAYHVIDVYSYGVTQEYRDTPRCIYARPVIVDPSYNIPSISAEQVHAGGSATLATLYNIQALLTDLEQIRRSQVYGYKTTLMDVLGKGHLADKSQNVTNWFAKEHTILYRLLISAFRTKEAFNKPIVDAMFKHNYILTWDDIKNRPVFKVDEFVVYL